MEFTQMILTTALVLLLIPAICLAVVLAEKKAPSKEYDERQEQARGRAYRLCFWFDLVYFGLVMCWQKNAEVFFPDSAPVYIVIYAGLLLTVMLFLTYCAISAAMFSNNPKQSPVWVTVCFLILGAGQLDEFFMDEAAKTGWPLPLGEENDWWFPLLTGIFFLYLGLLGVVQLMICRFTGERD